MINYSIISCTLTTALQSRIFNGTFVFMDVLWFMTWWLQTRHTIVASSSETNFTTYARAQIKVDPGSLSLGFPARLLKLNLVDYPQKIR
jgi:hypothetical protein